MKLKAIDQIPEKFQLNAVLHQKIYLVNNKLVKWARDTSKTSNFINTDYILQVVFVRKIH